MSEFEEITGAVKSGVLFKDQQGERKGHLREPLASVKNIHMGAFPWEDLTPTWVNQTA